MKRLLRKGSQEYEIVAWNEVRLDGIVKTFLDKNSAANFLRGFMCDRFNMMTMRNVLAETRCFCKDTSKLTDYEVIDQLAWGLVSGRIRLISRSVAIYGTGGGGGGSAGGSNNAEDIPLPYEFDRDVIGGEVRRKRNYNPSSKDEDEKNKLLLDLAQIVLDIAGIFEPTPFSDGTNAIISVCRADWFGAALSVVSLIPYIGDIAKVGKFPKFLKTIERVIKIAKTDAKFAKLVRPVMKKLRDGLNKIPLDSFPKKVQEPVMAMRKKLDDFFRKKAGKKITKQLAMFTQTTIDDVASSSAKLGKKGKITEGARAIQKKLGHAEKLGTKSAFEGIEATQENAEAIIRGIMNKPARTFSGDKVIDVYDTAGRGVRFDKNTKKFIGFLEEALATQ